MRVATIMAATQLLRLWQGPWLTLRLRLQLSARRRCAGCGSSAGGHSTGRACLHSRLRQCRQVLGRCLLLGLLAGLAAAPSWPSWIDAVVGTGFLGGYSTFSTASLEGARLLLDGRGGAALAHALAMTAGALAMALIGAGLGSALARIG